MITREQAKDLGVVWLVRLARSAFGWYWTEAQRAELDEAEDMARSAFEQHGLAARMEKRDRNHDQENTT